MTSRQSSCICGRQPENDPGSTAVADFSGWTLVTWPTGGTYASMYFCSFPCLAEWARGKAAA